MYCCAECLGTAGLTLWTLERLSGSEVSFAAAGSESHDRRRVEVRFALTLYKESFFLL